MDDKPSWSLLRLPTELIGRIVSFCKEQDERHSKRMQVLGSRDVDCELQDLWERRGGSLNKFSLTCKKVRSLCCPILFSTVTSKKGIKTSFRRRIALAMSSHFRRLEFSSNYAVTKESKEFVDLLIATSSLVNIDSLKLDSTHLKCLFVDYPDRLKFDQSLADQSDVSNGLRLILGRITSLELDSIDGDQTASILSRTNKRLSSLSLIRCGAHVVHDTPEAKQLQDGLTHFQKLERLLIEYSTNIFKAIDISSVAVYSLRSLSLCHHDFDALHVEFIARFAPTLESLSYESDQDFTDSTLSSSLLSKPFPRLKALTVRDSSNIYFLTNTSFAPSLLSLVVSTSASFFPRMAAFLPDQLSRMPPVESLCIGVNECDRMPRQPREELVQAMRRSGIKLRLTTPQDLLLAGEDELYGREESKEQTSSREYIGRRMEEVREVLDFGANYQEQIVRTGDTVGTDRLVEALRPLKMLQDSQEED